MASESPDLDSQTLVRAWDGGDSRAGELIVRRHYDRVLAYFRARVDPESAVDLTQVTFEALCRHRARFRGDSRLHTYLLAIARRKLLDHLRANRSETRQSTELEDAVLVDDAPSLVSIVHARVEEALVLQGMRSLCADDQLVLALKDHEGLTAREIAAIFDAPQGTIAGRIRRARQRLADVVRRLLDGGQRTNDSEARLETYMQNVCVRVLNANRLAPDDRR